MMRRLSVFITSTGLGLALVLAPTASSADVLPPNPVKDVLDSVETVLSPKKAQPTAEAPKPPALDDIPEKVVRLRVAPRNTTENSASPDHRSTGGLELDVLGVPIVGVNNGSTRINDNTSTADSTVLSLLGQEILGAPAASKGNHQDGFAFLAPLCDASAGLVCFSSLYSVADTGGVSPAAARLLGFLYLQIFGTTLPIFTLPFALPVPLMGTLEPNQGETHLASDSNAAGTSQDARTFSAARQPGAPLTFAGVAHTETLAHNVGFHLDDDDDDDDDEDDDGDDDDLGSDSDQSDFSITLPGSGGPSSALLALGMLGVGLGSATIAYGRRPRREREQG